MAGKGVKASRQQRRAAREFTRKQGYQTRVCEQCGEVGVCARMGGEMLCSSCLARMDFDSAPAAEKKPLWSERRFPTDDAGLPDAERMELVIVPPGVQGGGDDWYVAVVPAGKKVWHAVRFCTSGGASSKNPAALRAVHELWKALDPEAASCWCCHQKSRLDLRGTCAECGGCLRDRPLRTRCPAFKAET